MKSQLNITGKPSKSTYSEIYPESTNVHRFDNVLSPPRPQQGHFATVTIVNRIAEVFKRTTFSSEFDSLGKSATVQQFVLEQGTNTVELIINGVSHFSNPTQNVNIDTTGQYITQAEVRSNGVTIPLVGYNSTVLGYDHDVHPIGEDNGGNSDTE